MAAAAGVSKYHFLRCFAATYGRTPAVYLAERRIERAGVEAVFRDNSGNWLVLVEPKEFDPTAAAAAAMDPPCAEL